MSASVRAISGQSLARLWAVMDAADVPLWRRDAAVALYGTGDGDRPRDLPSAVVDALALLSRRALDELLDEERALEVPVTVRWDDPGEPSVPGDDRLPTGMDLAEQVARLRPDWPGSRVVLDHVAECDAWSLRLSDDRAAFVGAWAAGRPLEEAESAGRIFTRVWRDRHLPCPVLDPGTLPPLPVRFTDAAPLERRARFLRDGRLVALPELGWPAVDLAPLTGSQQGTVALALGFWSDVRADAEARLGRARAAHSTRQAELDGELLGTYGPHAVAFLDGRPPDRWSVEHRALGPLGDRGVRRG